MESLASKLKKNSKFNGKLFERSVIRKGDLGKMVDKTRDVKIGEGEKCGIEVRRRKRFNTAEPGGYVFEQVKKSSVQSGVHFVDLPVDFTRSLSNCSKNKSISKIEEPESLNTARFEQPSSPKKLSKDDQKPLSDFHLLNKLSQNSRQNSILLSKTGSFDLKNQDLSLSSNRSELPRLLKPEDSDFESPSIKPRPKVLRRLNHSQTELFYLDFHSALHKFNHSPVSFTESNLWIRSFYEKCCCWIKPSEFLADYQELCEKLIIFAYTNFDAGNVFHASLLVSVFHSLQDIVGAEGWEEAGFISNDPYLNELKHNVANFGLLLIMFLVDFLPGCVENMIGYCKKEGLAFVSIVFDVAEIGILCLRMRVLNKVMMEMQKCFEIVFFFAAGCLSEWFFLHKERVGMKKIGRILQRQAVRDPKSLVNLARDLMCLHV